MTYDTQFEKKWKPMQSYLNRKKQKAMTADEEHAFKKEHDGFNRVTAVDMPVFEGFLDQGAAMQDFMTPTDLLKANRFWERERNLGRLAHDVVKTFRTFEPGTYDTFAIKPMSYNLSIEKEGAKGDQEAKAKKEKAKKKKELLERRDGGAELAKKSLQAL